MPIEPNVPSYQLYVFCHRLTRTSVTLAEMSKDNQVIKIHHLGTMTVCTKFHNNPSKSCQKYFAQNQCSGPTALFNSAAKVVVWLKNEKRFMAKSHYHIGVILFCSS